MSCSMAGMVPKMNVIAYDPSDELKKQNHLLSTPVQTMYIMADLTPEGRLVTYSSQF